MGSCCFYSDDYFDYSNFILTSQYDKGTANICDFVGILSRINKLPRKFDTILSNEIEDGITLSGGEQQKIAIARALYNKNGALVFDEPSSSLDPGAEYEFNKKISLLKDKYTIVLISHRLSNVIDADSIYFMEQGTVVEHGSHNKLLADNGKYKQFFDMQSEGYKAENNSDIRSRI